MKFEFALAGIDRVSPRALFSSVSKYIIERGTLII